MKSISKYLSVFLMTSGLAQAATLATYGFDGGSLSVTSELYSGSSSDIVFSTGEYGDPAVTAAAWSADVTNENISILGDDVGTNVNLSTQSQFTFDYTVIGLLAGETLSIESISYDYTGFDGSVRVGASFGGSITTQNPTTGDSSHTTPLSRTGLVNGETVTIKFGLRDGSGGNGKTYTLDNLNLNGTVVPEPSSTALLGLGGLALILRRRK